MTAATATTTIQDISTITDAGLPSTIGTVARKRRRQILQSNRAKMTAEEVPVSKKPCVAAGTSGTGAGAQMGLSPPAMSAVPKATAVTANAIATVVKAKNGKTEKNKKQQLRYDPDVPMTKDEAAAWRREQRRKRNRESAAASRQKQKDRITELEGQIDEWKSKFEDAMKRIQQLEEARAPVVSDSEQALSGPVLTEETHEVRTTVSPCPSPPLSPVMSSTSPSSLDSTVGPSYPQGFITGQGSEGEENDNLIEISRPAVKITGVPFSLPPSNPALNEPIPDRAPSNYSEPIVAHDVADLLQSDMLPVDKLAPEPLMKHETNTTTLTLLSEEDEKELGDFMMDAFEWL